MYQQFPNTALGMAKLIQREEEKQRIQYEKEMAAQRYNEKMQQLSQLVALVGGVLVVCADM